MNHPTPTGRTGPTVRHAVPVADVRRLITEIRRATGWTYHQLAERAGVSRSTVAHVMAGGPRLYVQGPVAAQFDRVHEQVTARRCERCEEPTTSRRARYCPTHRAEARQTTWRESGRQRRQQVAA